MHLKTTVNGTDVSTVKLPFNEWYETCLFYADGTSEVMETYISETEARAGHARWVEEVKKGQPDRMV